MPRPRRYSDELRERAVRLRLEQMDRPVTHIARELGIGPESLRLWVKQHEADHGESKDTLATVEREELKLLRKENTRLRKANQVLKDASVFFATELDQTQRR